MSIIRFIYIILHVWEIGMLFIAGKKISCTKTDEEYWKASLWAFIPYSVVLGLRFGHNIDWNYYCQRYIEHQTMDWDTTEPIFHFTFYFFNSLGIPYFVVISLQVIFFMYSFLLIAKHFRNCLYYVLPLLPVVAQSNDNYIRWYWAVSFVLIAFFYLLSDKKRRIIKSILFFTAGVFTHNASIILILFLPLCYFGKKHYLSPYISFTAIFISIFFISISVISYFSDFANLIYLQGGDIIQESKVSSYLLKVNDIAEGGLSSTTGIKVYGLINKFITLLAFCPIIIYGPKYLKNYQYGILYYNLFIIGAFLNPFFSTVEIFDRYSKFLLIFQAIVAGIVYYNILIKDHRLRKELKIFCFISMLCCFYPFIRYSLLTKAEYRMLYIWDKKERNYINPTLYLNDMLKNKK